MFEDYSIRPLCYAHVDLPREFFGGVPIHSGEGLGQAPMLYTLLTHREATGSAHHYLVDVGFRAEKWIHRFGFYDYENPELVLDKVGVTPEQIEKVFLTHMHFDHANNLTSFPNAEVYVQWDEYVGWTRALGLPSPYTPLGAESWITSSFDREDFLMYGGLLRDQRLRFIGDGDEMAPGIHGHLSRDGHTFGTQWVSVDTPGGRFVCAGDSVMWYSNVDEMWPSGYTNGNTYNMMMTYAAIREHLSGSLENLVPGHDIEVFRRNNAWSVRNNEVAEMRLGTWDSSRRPVNP